MPTMAFRLCTVLLSLAATGFAAFLPQRSSSPTIKLDSAILTGIQSSSGNTSSFLGIPYAQPPVGNLRFRLPQLHTPYTGSINATAYGHACIQQTSTIDIPSNISPIAAQLLAASAQSTTPLTDSEDCLNIDVIIPENANPSSKLPVVFWIFGGGFETGATSRRDGSVIVERSLELGEPVVFVAVNYRLNALGFAGSKEIRQAGLGNLGLQDQRLGLQWVQKYIAAFGGDPTKVTIWGQSAGAISVAMQMLANGGSPGGLYRAAFMESGSPIPTGPVEDGQQYFDTFATAAGCAKALGSPTVFDCLRGVSTDVIRNATNLVPSTSSFESLALAWVPRADGSFLTANPQQLVQRGDVASVPFVTGDVDDEGTVFALTNSNLTTDDEVAAYLEDYYVKGLNSTAAVAEILSFYTSDVTEGSPFDTGVANAITAQYKRIAAILGDLVFQAPRRFFQSSRAGKQPQFAFLSKRAKSTVVVGSSHGSDLNNVFGPGDMTDYLVRFAANLDPNGATGITWPAYTPSAPTLLTFLDGATPLALSNDTYRLEGMQALIRASLDNPL